MRTHAIVLRSILWELRRMIMSGTHDRSLVLLSVVIATFASFTALSLASRVRASQGWVRRVWLWASTVSLGGGIWSMHFVAMLAFSMPGMETSYDPALTLLSLALALGFTGAGFAVMNWDRVSRGRVAAAGLLMGSGVVAMHYLGMAAMRMPATLSYGRTWLAISVLIAIGAATAALWLAARDQKLSHRWVAAAVMGAAIAGMHYAGMKAAVFRSSGAVDLAGGKASLGQTYLAGLVSATTFVILLMALGAARLERLFQGFARREARIALRLRIADACRERNSGDALRDIAALMGAHFAVARTGYGRLEPAEDVFDYDICWTDGTVVPLLGRIPSAQLGARLRAAMDRGETVAVHDLTEEGSAEPVAAGHPNEAPGARAVLAVPFARDGRVRTILYLHDRAPRMWHRDDIAFMEEIAERTRLVIERAAVEEELRDLNATLEARVEARTRELRDAQEALLQSQKMEAVGQLVSGLAHDFNNVLGAVVGAFDLIRRRAEDAERVRPWAEAGLQAADRGAKLTAQLLAFSRSQRIQLRPVLVCEILEGLRDLLARTLGPMIVLEIRLDLVPAPVLADPTQIEMMVLNLVINARDAMPQGGRLTIFTEKRCVGGDEEIADGDYVELAVRDTGIGMDEETCRRAMEPFFTTKPVGKGTGLGLAQIYGSARQFGGTVRLQSSPGCGTTVRVLLPLTDRRPDASRGDEADGEPDAARAASILLVDDDDALREMVASALIELGHSVVQAPDGPGALDVLLSHRPDVAVIDYAMPGMTGAELARRIAEGWPDLPVLFASGYADTDAVDGAVGPGGAIMLRKPYRVTELILAIRSALISDVREDPDAAGRPVAERAVRQMIASEGSQAII